MSMSPIESRPSFRSRRASFLSSCPRAPAAPPTMIIASAARPYRRIVPIATLSSAPSTEPVTSFCRDFSSSVIGELLRASEAASISSSPFRKRSEQLSRRGKSARNKIVCSYGGRHVDVVAKRVGISLSMSARASLITFNSDAACILPFLSCFPLSAA